MNGGDLEVTGRQAELRRQWLSSQKDGAVVKETLEKETLPKTNQQVKMHWGLAIAMIIEEFNHKGWDSSMLFNFPTTQGSGSAVTGDQLQEYFYALFPVYRDDRRIGLSRMSTVEASTFFDQIRNFAASQWSINIPEPQKDWKENDKTPESY